MLRSTYVCFNADKHTATDLEEQAGVETNDTRLVWYELACVQRIDGLYTPGWATSAKMQSTMGSNMRYLRG